MTDYEAPYRAWVFYQNFTSLASYRNIIRLLTEYSKPTTVNFKNHSFETIISDVRQQDLVWQQVVGIRCDIHPHFNLMALSIEYANDYRYIDNGTVIFFFTIGPFKQSWQKLESHTKLGYITIPVFHPTKPIMAFRSGSSWIQTNMLIGQTSCVRKVDEWIASSRGRLLDQNDECYHIANSFQTVLDRLGCIVRCRLTPQNTIRFVIYPKKLKSKKTKT